MMMPVTATSCGAARRRSAATRARRRGAATRAGPTAVVRVTPAETHTHPLGRSDAAAPPRSRTPPRRRERTNERTNERPTQRRAPKSTTRDARRATHDERGLRACRSRRSSGDWRSDEATSDARRATSRDERRNARRATSRACSRGERSQLVHVVMSHERKSTVNLETTTCSETSVRACQDRPATVVTRQLFLVVVKEEQIPMRHVIITSAETPAHVRTVQRPS